MALDDLRLRIDELDDGILELLDERARVVAEVATAKRDASLPTYDPSRERAILDRLAARASRFPADAIRAVYREVMSACLALQEPMNIAYLGPEGTFSHTAARAFFGLAATYNEAATIDGVFDVDQPRRDAHHGVVPIENSSERVGRPRRRRSGQRRSSIIRAEIEIDVAQCLVTRATGLASIERVYSHPHALGQCRLWLAKHISGAQLVQASSTAAAVREAAADERSAAVASRLCSELYGVPVLRERIQDHAQNVTRFAIVSLEDAPRTGADKTTVAFSVHDGRGALMRVLILLDAEGLNLTRIESRPSRERPWDYVFLADLEGHRDDANVARAMDRMRAMCPMVKHLGSYPRAVANRRPGA